MSMEANKVEVVSSAMEKVKSHHCKVCSGVRFNNIDKFDYLMEIDDSEFEKYNLPVLPSLHLPSLPVQTIEIEEVAKMGVIDSIYQEEMSIWGSIVGPEDSTLGHAQSLYVDSGFIVNADNGKKTSGKSVVEGNMDHLHQKGNDVDVGRSPFLVARAMPPEKLIELAKTNPKKANRILANRNSAAKSKERKKIYENELENRVKNLQAQVDNVSEQLLLTKRDITARSTWNNALRMQIEAKRQELQHRRAPYEALRKELEYYRIKTSQFAADMTNGPSGLAMQHGCDPNPSSQHQAPLQPQISLPPLPPSLPFNHPFDEHYGSGFSNFNLFN